MILANMNTLNLNSIIHHFQEKWSGQNTATIN